MNNVVRNLTAVRNFVGSILMNESAKPDVNKPGSLEGATEEEAEEAAKEDGFTESHPTREPGKALTKPGNRADQVRIMPGKATDPNPVKQGPYVRISKGGKVSDPIPLKGNPTLRK